MSSYDVKATSRASAAQIWSLLVDGATWPTWSPIDSCQADPSGDGDIRIFRTGSNVSRERVVESDAERRLDYEMVSGSRLLRGYRGRVDLEPAGDGGTHIRWRASWRPPFPGLGLFMQAYLSRFQQRMVDGLARYAEQGSRP